MKELNGRELASFVKERQARQVRSLKGQGVQPKLVIIRDSENPVIMKYVGLKKRYGEDIGVAVEEIFAQTAEEIIAAIENANSDDTVSGIIVQLPLVDSTRTDEVISKIAPEKDVDGLAGSILDVAMAKGKAPAEGNTMAGDAVAVATTTTTTTTTTTATDNNQKTSAINPERHFDPATATAINWLLTGYDIDLTGKKIAIVGRGRLVGAPLIRMWRNSGLDVSVFGRDGNLSELKDFDVIVTATGIPHLITSEMVKPGAVIVDAGTASEDGVLMGDVDDAVRSRTDLKAITPIRGGVGPLTVSVLFDDTIVAATKKLSA